MGVRLNMSTDVRGDDLPEIHDDDTSEPESTLKKRANSACCHFARDSVAVHDCRKGCMSTHENPADVATKPLPCGHTRDCSISVASHFHDKH